MREITLTTPVTSHSYDDDNGDGMMYLNELPWFSVSHMQ